MSYNTALFLLSLLLFNFCAKEPMDYRSIVCSGYTLKVKSISNALDPVTHESGTITDSFEYHGYVRIANESDNAICIKYAEQDSITCTLTANYNILKGSSAFENIEGYFIGKASISLKFLSPGVTIWTWRYIHGKRE